MSHHLFEFQAEGDQLSRNLDGHALYIEKFNANRNTNTQDLLKGMKARRAEVTREERVVFSAERTGPPAGGGRSARTVTDTSHSRLFKFEPNSLRRSPGRTQIQTTVEHCTDCMEDCKHCT